MLEETTDELLGVKLHGFPLESLAVLITKADTAVICRKNSSIGDGVTENISAQVIQDTLSAVDGRFGVGVPFLGRAGEWRSCGQRRSSHGNELAGKSFRQSSGRDEVGLSCGAKFAVAAEAGPGDQEMDMWVVPQSPRPGMENAKRGNLAPEILGVPRGCHPSH